MREVRSCGRSSSAGKRLFRKIIHRRNNRFIFGHTHGQTAHNFRTNRRRIFKTLTEGSGRFRYTHTHARPKRYEMNEYKKKKTMENGLLQFRPLYNTFSSAILKAAEIFVRIKAVFVSRGSFFLIFRLCVCVDICFFRFFFSRAEIFNNGGRFEIFIRNWHRMWFRLIIRYYRALFRS